MGWFNLFKKNTKKDKTVAKCSKCFLPISGNPHDVDGKKFCNECYNKMYYFNKFPQNQVDEYSIGIISEKNRWIFILINGQNERDDPKPFAELVKEVAANSNKGEWQGNIVPVSEGRFAVKNEKLPLIYQFDSFYGIVIEYPESEQLDAVLQHLKNVAGINIDVKPQ